MVPSYRTIDYSLRPAKTVERKMLCEAFRRLHPFGKIEAYKYIGMGSIYFSDFILFHRALGITKMLSIEKDEYAKDCFEFNKPFGCINLDFRKTTVVLPEQDISRLSIIWLDYDGPLESDVLADVGTVCTRIGTGCVLILSVNAQPDNPRDEHAKKEYRKATGLDYELDAYRIWRLKERLDDNVPQEVRGGDLGGKGLATVSRRLIDAKIRNTLSARNSLIPTERKLQYEQLFNFIYSDGAKMTTVGGVFFEEWHRPLFQACSFDELNFVRFGMDSYFIKVPCLTPKEMRHLNAQLPITQPSDVQVLGVPTSDIKNYSELYRYFPTFTETLLA